MDSETVRCPVSGDVKEQMLGAGPLASRNYTKRSTPYRGASFMEKVSRFNRMRPLCYKGVHFFVQRVHFDIKEVSDKDSIISSIRGRLNLANQLLLLNF